MKNSGKNSSLTMLSVKELSTMLHGGVISTQEVTEAFLASAAEQEEAIHAYITVTEARARKDSESAQKMLSEGKGGALCGIPCSVKDNIALRGYPMTCASAMLKDFIPPYSAMACERLEEQGAVILGKTNMDEFAMGSACEQSVFGSTRNPLDPTRSAGGSSGGAAASVAAGEAAFALGSDTGGSARQPAAFCGLVSMKPTYGLVSRFGLVELASSFEQICPITRTVEDNALVLSAICGKDARDMTSIDAADAFDELIPGIRGRKIAVFAGYEAYCDPKVADRMERCIETLCELGAVLETAEMPSPDLARDIYFVTMSAEASSNLARYDGIKYGSAGETVLQTRSECFGEEVRRRIITGSYALSSVYQGDYYRKIRAARGELCKRLEALYSRYDMILMPTAGTVAFPLGSFDSSPTGLYDSDRFTVYANLTGCPAITVPCGKVDGLPVGMTLMGPRLSERMLYEAALAFEAEEKTREGAGT